jgi:D-proline reductase (dithiol) PrdB
VVKGWIEREGPRQIPWTPLAKPVSECRVAVINTGGIALKSDKPFDQDGERKNPWWGDPSYRIIPHDATAEDVEIYHLHIDPTFCRQDLNCLIPLQRLAEMREAGEIGDVAPRHYSYMGYILEPTALLEESTPAIIRHLSEDQVDLVLLVPT